MLISRQQITARGVAQQSGLDIFSSVINYTGEYVNWGDFYAYESQLNSDTKYDTIATNPQTDALINNPPSVISRWYRYSSADTGLSPYVSTNAPAINSRGVVSFFGRKIGDKTSYSGMYQKLQGLTVGKKYEISIQSSISADSADMYIETYSPDGVSFIATSSYSFSFPSTNNTTGIQKTTFIAKTTNDIVLIYANATVETENNITVNITNISIKEEQEYLVPVYAEDMWGNAHNVLRLNAGNTISDV